MPLPPVASGRAYPLRQRDPDDLPPLLGLPGNPANAVAIRVIPGELTAASLRLCPLPCAERTGEREPGRADPTARRQGC